MSDLIMERANYWASSDVFDVETRKIEQLKLNNDSTSMGFLIFLQPKYIIKEKKVDGEIVREELKIQPNQ